MIKKFASFVLIVAVIAMNFGFMATNVADAAQVTVLSDVVSNLSAGALANHTITFTSPTGLASGATLTLTFDNGTSTDAAMTFADIDFRYGATDVTLAAAPSGATMGVVRTSATVLTFTNGTTVIAGGQVIVIKIGTNTTVGGTGTKQTTNGSAGTTLLRIGGTFGDTGAISLPIIANSVVAVSAEVLSALSFTLSHNAIYFGNLRTTGNCFAQNTNPGYVTCPTTTETEAFNMTAGTNATSGYTISVQGPTLTSGANTIANLVTNTAASFGNEQFGLRMTASGGTGAVDALYSAAGFAFNGVASPSTVATASAPSATTTYSVRYLANISALTKAGSYTTNHTYIATGNF